MRLHQTCLRVSLKPVRLGIELLYIDLLNTKLLHTAVVHTGLIHTEMSPSAHLVFIALLLPCCSQKRLFHIGLVHVDLKIVQLANQAHGGRYLRAWSVIFSRMRLFCLSKSEFRTAPSRTMKQTSPSQFQFAEHAFAFMMNHGLQTSNP